MEISEPSPVRGPRVIDPAAARPRPPQSSPPSGTDPVDRIEVSAAGRSIAGVDDLARARRVAELRARIDAGAYTVDPAALARRLSERGAA